MTPATKHTKAFPADRTTPTRARTWLRDVLATVEGYLAYDALLLLSELVTNSVVHGGLGKDDEIAVQVVVDEETIYVEVSDHGPHWDVDLAQQARGRGLQIVQRVADRFGAESDGTNRVWFELSRGPKK